MTNARDKANIPVLNFQSKGIDDNADATSVTIDSSENVGIKNTTPSNFNASANQLVVGSGSGNNGITIFSGTSNNSSLFLADGTTATNGYRGSINYLHNGDALTLHANATETMRLTNGKVSIGTTATNQKLNIFDSSNSQMNFYTSGTGTGTGDGFRVGYNGSVGQLYLFEDADFRIATNDSEKFRIKSDGKVGIGVISPDRELTVGGVSNARIGILTTDNSSGASQLHFGDADNSQIGRVYYDHSDNSMRLHTNNSERMRITSGGQIWMKTSSTSLTNATQVVFHPGSSEYGIRINSTGTSGTQYHLSFDRGQTQAGYITSNSATTIAFNNASDERLKENIENSGSALQDIKDLKVRQFDWKDNIDTHRDFGFVAQELHSIIPEAVSVGSDELDDNGKPKQSWGVDYSHIVPRLVKAVQEQQTRIESLEAEVTALKNQP